MVGDPIAHSKSPRIHSLFAAQVGLALTYEKVRVPAGNLTAALAAFRAAKGHGLNVTVPLKEEAYQLVDVAQPRARASQAVNTLWFDAAGEVHGDNTDGVGLVLDLETRWERPIAGRSILVIGAGGAARGIIPALLDAAPCRLTVANRSMQKATQLAAEFERDVSVEVTTLDSRHETPSDLIINATSTGLSATRLPLHSSCIGSHTRCYDLSYGSRPTSFLAWCVEHGAQQCADGLGMLVEQAAEAFYLWHGVRPRTQPVVEHLRG